MAQRPPVISIRYEDIIAHFNIKCNKFSIFFVAFSLFYLIFYLLPQKEWTFPPSSAIIYKVSAYLITLV